MTHVVLRRLRGEEAQPSGLRRVLTRGNDEAGKKLSESNKNFLLRISDLRACQEILTFSLGRNREFLSSHLIYIQETLSERKDTRSSGYQYLLLQFTAYTSHHLASNRQDYSRTCVNQTLEPIMRETGGSSGKTFPSDRTSFLSNESPFS